MYFLISSLSQKSHRARLFAAVSGAGVLFSWSKYEQREIKRFPLYCVFTLYVCVRVTELVYLQDSEI